MVTRSGLTTERLANKDRPSQNHLKQACYKQPRLRDRVAEVTQTTPGFTISNDAILFLAALNAKSSHVTEEEFLTFSKVALSVRFFICFFGTVLNGLCIRAYHKIGLENNVTIIFFFLAVLDFCHLLASIALAILSIYDILIREGQLWVDLHPAMFFLFNVINRIFIEPAFLVTTFLAVQRCLCVVRPLHFKEFFTRQRTNAVLILIFLFCLVFYVAFILQHKIVKLPLMPQNSSALFIYFAPAWKQMSDVMFLLFNVILNASTQIIISLCVLIMARALARSVRFRQAASFPSKGVQAGDKEKGEGQGQVTKRERPDNVKASAAAAGTPSNAKERQAITQVALVCGIFLVCNIPRLIVATTVLIVPEMDSYVPNNFLFYTFHVTYLFFEDLNSSVNFFVYYKYNIKFREACFKPQSPPKT